MRCLACFFFAAFSFIPSAPGASLITNGGFETGLAGWRPFWSRQANAGKVTLETEASHSGNASIRIEHRGTNDWSFEPGLRVSTHAGEVFELQVWLKLEGPGYVTLCASTWNAQDQVVNWSHGGRAMHASSGWRLLRSRFVAPAGVTRIQPRLIGDGPAVVWADDYSFVRLPEADATKRTQLPVELVVSNQALAVTFNTTNATLSILDQRSGQGWKQVTLEADILVVDAISSADTIESTLLHVPSGLDLKATIQLDRDRPEFTLAFEGRGELDSALRFPHPFVSESGDRLIVPLNEGISYPAEDTSIEPARLVTYGGHGICMAFWGVTDERRGYATIIETPDDAAISLQRFEGRLLVAPEWDPQQGQFGYSRRLRYVFFNSGGHVAIAKRYRSYAQQVGLLKTLAEKRRENPAVDLLVGAVNVWNWDSEPVRLVRDMRAAGIDRILWSRGAPASAIRELNEMKVLTSRYDIYQDVMAPANFSSLNGVHGDWTTAAWPDQIVRRSDGSWQRGWGVKGKDGEWFYCGVLCDLFAPRYAGERIAAELSTHPYKCRFIDTTTASPWNECYSTNHPTTRTQSRVWRMKLLECVSRDQKLVTGCETGHDAAVPFLHYFEGMLSLGPYRVPDAGRDIQRIWEEVPDRVAKFQVGHTYRLPLWELVYHDCVVSQWYWGDYSNKLPSLWTKRDLFNVLYGTPPMFMFNRRLWDSQKERFARSYRNTCPVVRDTGYSEMTDHRFLTPDRNVQQTVFANGTTITVNFGDRPYRAPSGYVLDSMDFHVGKKGKAL